MSTSSSSALVEEFRAWLRAHAAELAAFTRRVPVEIEKQVEHERVLQRMLWDAGWLRRGWPESSGGSGGSHFFQEIRLGHSGDHEIEPEEIRVDPRREEGHVVALDRGPHFGLQRIAVENLLPAGAVLVAEGRGALKIEKELAQPVISHSRYFAMSAALLFRSPISGERHEPHRQGAFRRRAAVRLFFHDEELLHLR